MADLGIRQAMVNEYKLFKICLDEFVDVQSIFPPLKASIPYRLQTLNMFIDTFYLI